MKRGIFLLSLSPLFLFAAQVDTNADYDIIPRTINFFLFVAILCYFIVNPAKNFYKNRIARISSRLEDIQRRVLESKNKKLEMIKKLEDAKKEAQVAINSAQKEAEILAQKIKSETKNSINILERQFEEQQNYEKRKMQREVVSHTLALLFDDKKTELQQSDIINIILKKVS